MHSKTLGSVEHNESTVWNVAFHEDFLPEFVSLTNPVQKALAAHVEVLRQQGPMLPRPYADTLKGSIHPNMKELRFNAENGVWRVAYAFDPNRRAILLVAGDKVGKSKKLFYANFISVADRRFSQILTRLGATRK
jgi:hypothetical protein